MVKLENPKSYYLCLLHPIDCPSPSKKESCQFCSLHRPNGSFFFQLTLSLVLMVPGTLCDFEQVT